jgi:hypothetical protein
MLYFLVRFKQMVSKVVAGLVDSRREHILLHPIRVIVDIVTPN